MKFNLKFSINRLSFVFCTSVYNINNNLSSAVIVVLPDYAKLKCSKFNRNKTKIKTQTDTTINYCIGLLFISTRLP